MLHYCRTLEIPVSVFVYVERLKGLHFQLYRAAVFFFKRVESLMNFVVSGSMTNVNVTFLCVA